MKFQVGLFIPCYIDQFYPDVGIATIELLEKLGVDESYPLDQTCCGQPLANSGFAHYGNKCDENFVKNFYGFDYIVCPSGSCTFHLKEHLNDNKHQDKSDKIKERMYELTEFLTDILKIEKLNASFPHKVGLHTSCHGQRFLNLCSMSETVTPYFSKPEKLLAMVDKLELSKPEKPDECCGFGGTFSIFEEAVSVKMGQDRIKEHIKNGVEFITGYDMSCLMHLEGILRREKSNIKVIHIAEILNSN